MKILMVPTSHDQLGNSGRKTGFWLEEFAVPYFVFRDKGYSGGSHDAGYIGMAAEKTNSVDGIINFMRNIGRRRSGCGLAKLFREAIEWRT